MMEPPKDDADLSSSEMLKVLQDVAARRGSGEDLGDKAVCAAHPELMPAIEGHLKYLGLAGQARVTSIADAVEWPWPGVLIPGYAIVREIHRGGQGVVYQAVQNSTRREVAIKVLHAGPSASEQERARFEREVQVLAALKHPNIVAVHDSGMAAGCFYFVMDYVSGQPLDLFMDAHRAGMRHALVLFRKICEAVNAAHLRGVIHRDLKPGNIRIDSEGEPHILDFGLAKIAHGNLGAETVPMTVTGQFVGSLPWASPEQAEGAPGNLDVRSDVYSLGVILYQMLTGVFPYEVGGGFREVLDRITNVQPVRPSILRPDLDDEIDTIVLKALAKPRERRYQSAGDLARDIGHYLDGEPVEAKRDSSWYLLKKKMRRYRALAAMAVAFAILVAAGLVSSTVLWRQAARSRDETRAALAAQEREAQRAGLAEKLARERLTRAEQETRKAEATSQFLTNVFTSARGRKDGRPVTVEEVLDLASRNLETDSSLAGTPEVEIALRRTLASTYYLLGLTESADRQFQTAMDLCRRNFGEESPVAIRVRTSMAWANRRNPLWEPHCRATLADARRVLGPADVTTLKLMNALAENLFVSARLDMADTRLAEAEHLLLEVQAAGPAAMDAPWRCITLYQLANVVHARRRPDQAETLRRQAMELDPAGTITEQFGWWGVVDNLLDDGRLDEAEVFLRKAYQACRRTSGEERDVTASICEALANLLERRGKARHDEVETLYCDRVRSLRASQGDQHPATLKTLQALGRFYNVHGRHAEAEQVYRELCDSFRRAKGQDDEGARMAAWGLARALEGQNRVAEAEAAYIQVIRTLQSGSSRIGDLLTAETELARFYRDTLRFADAEKTYLQCQEDCRRLLGPSDGQAAACLQGLLTLYLAWGRPERAEMLGADMQKFDAKIRLQLIGDLMVRMPDHLESLFPACVGLDSPELSASGCGNWPINLAGRVVAFSGDFDRATRIFRFVAQRDRSTNAGYRYILGWAELLAGRPSEAMQAFTQARQGTHGPAVAIASYFLGQVSEQTLLDSSAGLGWFFIGERRLLSDDCEGAREAYRNCIAVQTSDASPANYARLRMRQLQQNSCALPRPLPEEERFWTAPPR